MDKKSTLVRAASGSVYVLLIILACWCGEIGITLLSALLAALGIREFHRMHSSDDRDDIYINIYNMLGGVLLTLTVYVYPFYFWLLWAIGRMIITIYSKNGRPEKEYLIDMAAQVYIGLPLALMTGLGYFSEELCNSGMPVLSIFILIWINDTGAFIFGSLFGKHKLFPRVSPKKSWEGFWGGCLCTVLVGVLIGALHSPLSAEYLGNKLFFWGLTGLVVSLASTFGDLFESVIKRNLNLKDSGNLIPGHGGILDRIDSLLMVIPAVTIYVAFYAIIILEVLVAYDPAVFNKW